MSEYIYVQWGCKIHKAVDGIGGAYTHCGIEWHDPEDRYTAPFPIKNINDKYHKKIPRCKKCFKVTKK